MITACLLSWKRAYHLFDIVWSLRRFQQIDEVIVWDNANTPESELPSLPPGTKVITSDENKYVHGRFLAAEHAKNSVLFFQDDDLIVNNIPTLIERFEANNGEKIVANLADDRSSRHWNWWQVHRPHYVELGFGSLAPKSAIRILDDWPYDQGLLERKADKIFTVMNEWEAVYAGPQDISRLFRDGEESGRDGNSLWLREDHKRLTEEAVRLALRWAETCRNDSGSSVRP